MTPPKPDHHAGQVVLPCDDVEATVAWFKSECGFRLDMISPADCPSIAELTGHGLRIRLDMHATQGPTTLRLPHDGDARLPITSPGGTVIEWMPPPTKTPLPQNLPAFVLSRATDSSFEAGRAGMHYRDLIPDRQGGRFIASHISIPIGGPVPDYVHHHDIRFQMIFCHAGTATLVYEDQGEAFLFEAGDCVLQPPHIRHQVLDTSDAFEVVEIACPAEHLSLIHISEPTRPY